MNTYVLPPDLSETVARALAEDIGAGDLTAALVPAQAFAQAYIIAREPGVLCGSAWAAEALRQVAPQIRIDWQSGDGDFVTEGTTLCALEGPSRGILTAERTALNFLQTLSGTATRARRYAEAVQGLHATVIDTRKTLPGLRSAQKYAVAVGGCGNHRMGLYDFILIKENHIAAAGGVSAALAAARHQQAGVPIEIEVETLKQLKAALAAGAERILLDNFDLVGLREAVRVTAGRARLEASGNVAFEGLRELAETGVDYISVGALTKHVHALDLSLRFVGS
jgi:nicotinate-nucleotide pyrophosphorylase (carboxylating)